MGSLSCRRWHEEARLLLSRHTRAEAAVAPWQHRDPAQAQSWALPHIPARACRSHSDVPHLLGQKRGRSLQEWHFPGLPTIFWKDQPIFVLDGERPLRQWVEYKSLLSHCSKQTPTKSHSNYFLQRHGKALFCILPAQEDTQDWLFPFSKPVAVYTFPWPFEQLPTQSKALLSRYLTPALFWMLSTLVAPG